MHRHNKTHKKGMAYGMRHDMNECHEVTFQGLQCWYKCKFEKLGWMVLAHAHGHIEKVMEYKNSVRRLKCTVEKKIKEIHDVDKKNDLKIMLANLEILMEHVEKDFPL